MFNIILGETRGRQFSEPMLISLVDVKDDSPKEGGKGTTHIVKNDSPRRVCVCVIYKIHKHS